MNGSARPAMLQCFKPTILANLAAITFLLACLANKTSTTDHKLFVFLQR